MTTKSGSKKRSTAVVPDTAMVEVPVLSADERAAFLHSLAEAEARIAAGKFVEYETKSFRTRLIEAYRAAKSTAGA